jgi:hypothetical protein
MVQEVVQFDQKVTAMLHKIDVFSHTLPEDMKTEYDFFRSFMIQNGERSVTIDLVAEMFSSTEESLRLGQGLFDAILARTDDLATSAECVTDDDDLRMFIVEQPSESGPIDLPRYQQKIDELTNDTPTLFLTRTHAPLPTGMYNLGLRRAGAGVDISKVAAALKRMPPFISGGGHPYAGGAQSRTLATREQIIELVGAAARESLEPSSDEKAQTSATSSSARPVQKAKAEPEAPEMKPRVSDRDFWLFLAVLAAVAWGSYRR